MAAPIEAAETRIALAVMAQLERIKRDGGAAKWLTRPATIGEAPLGLAMTVDLPALFLHLADWKDAGMMAQGLHDATATYHVMMMSARTEFATREQQRLCRDVRKALAEGEAAIENSLKIAGQPYAGDGSVVVAPVGYTYQYEISEKIGLAIGSYVFTVSYVWQHSNP